MNKYAKLYENLDISDIDLTKPTFIFISGATGSGKNYIAKKYFSGVDLVDIDQYMAKFAKETKDPDKDERSFVGKSIIYATKELEKHFKSSKSVVQVGTGGNLKGTLNKFIKAKYYEFQTVLILVDTDIKKAQKRNLKRAEKGDQRLVPQWKVEKSYEASKENFDILRGNPNIDLSFKIQN